MATGRRLSQQSELAAALTRVRGGFIGVAAMSVCLNVLTLTGSIYLMLVYDRVLPSQSQVTLFSVFLLVALAYAFYAAFDIMRSRMLSDIGSSLDRGLSVRAQRMEFQLAVQTGDSSGTVSPVRDLDQIRGFLSSAGPAALIDLPWIVFFVVLLSLVSIWLGIATLIGGIAIAILTWITDRSSRTRVATLNEASRQRALSQERNRRHAEVLTALGMRDRILYRATMVNRRFLTAQTELSELTATLGGISRVARMFLQSIVLTVGALLVIDGKASGGIIFASSILSGRALAPVDQAIANWRGFVSARQSWARLNRLLSDNPPRKQRDVVLPAPVEKLSVDNLTLAPPGTQRVAVANISFEVKAGDAVGIVGPSASGKSSLARGIVGAWPIARGSVRLDGAETAQWDSEMLGRHIGYLPQSVELFDGTIAENIARLDPEATSEGIIAAAQAAGVHDIVLQLPGGYEMNIGQDGQHLSAGQRQRIALARALYGDPFLIVLDEPNSNLDPEGEAALARAIEGARKRGAIVLLVAHRLSILQAVNQVLALRGGRLQAFGPRDEVLRSARQSRPGEVPAPAVSTLSIVPASAPQ